MTEENKLVAGVDYYLDVNGLMVLTGDFLKRRGYCCMSGCRHCPYPKTRNFDPNFPIELQLADEDKDEEDFGEF